MNDLLDSRQLRAFQVLARTGSFTQAAREIQITQSGISHSMKALETEIGCRLLDRLGKKVVLTQAGKQFLEHADKILREMELARESLAPPGKWGQGRLRLGAGTTACQHFIPTVLREFKKSFPDHGITLESGDTPQLIDLLLRQRIDLALTLEAEGEPKLEWRHLFTDELQLVVSATHPWAREGRVEPGEIPRQNYIVDGRNSVTFRLIEDYFRRANIVPGNVTVTGSLEASKELVKLGLGVSVLAPWMAQKEIEEGSLVALPPGRKKLLRKWGLLHGRGRRLSLAEETFIGLCESATAHLNNELPGGKIIKYK